MDIASPQIEADVRDQLASDPRLPLQRLIWDPEIPGGYLDVDVRDGWLTLKGEVDYQYQSDRAFDHAASLYGVTGVTNEIRVVERL